jgi:hypothetical protein
VYMYQTLCPRLNGASDKAVETPLIYWRSRMAPPFSQICYRTPDHYAPSNAILIPT